jgi:hypothetical protein
MHIQDDFAEIIDPRWKITQQGSGSVYRRPGALHLALQPDESNQTYHNAQITEYSPAQKDFQFRAPLTMKIQAYSSLHPANIRGTAGFGFWNHPFSPDQKGWGLPQTLWFFFSGKDSNMALARGVQGNGWKAATMDARRGIARVLLPFAPLAMPLMRVNALYNALYPIGQSALAIQEASLDAELLTAIHEYEIEWRNEGAIFRVDGEIVQQTRHVPKGALGFIAWMDNQFAVVTPQGNFQMGLVPVDKAQSLVLESIEINES